MYYLTLLLHAIFSTNGNWVILLLCLKTFPIFFFIHTDVDECLAGVHDCDPNADCVNTPDSFKCICQQGFLGDGRNCFGKLTQVTTKHKLKVEAKHK